MRVITYQLAYLTNQYRTLCDRHASDEISTLGSVSHGAHQGTCDACLEQEPAFCGRDTDGVRVITYRLSIAGMRIEDAWKLPRHHPESPAVYVRDDGRLTIDSGEVDSRPFVGRLENWSYQESDDCLYGELVFYSEHSAGTVPADPATLANGVSRKAPVESVAGPLTEPVGASDIGRQLDAVDSELMKQGLPPRPKKVVKPPALTQGEVFMRLGKDSQAKRWARALVDHQTSAYYWRTSSATGREVRQRVAKEHGPEFDEKLFLAVGGQKGKKGRDKSLSWEKLEQYVRLVPTEETAQDRQLGGDA